MSYKTLGVFFASVAMVAAVVPAQSDEGGPPFADDEIPLTEYYMHLIQTYGVDAVIKKSTIEGYQFQTDPSTKNNFKDEFPPPTGRITPLYLTLSPPNPCTNIIDSPPPAGGIKNKWCGVSYHPSGSTQYYEARRDTYAFSAGSWSYTRIAVYFDCQDPNDVALMTDTVKNLVC